jgi:thiol:disulfide interchange protein DsbC
MTIMRTLQIYLAFFLGGLSFFALAQSNDKIKTELQKQFGANVQIKSIAPSPIAGIFEVVINNTVVYTDASAKYLIQGSIVELKTGTNLTEQKENELNKIKFSDLAIKDALKTVRGDGTRVIAVFADPNCGYCKTLEKNLLSMDNITIFTYLIPILSADSTAKSKAIWCSAEPSKAWINLMTQQLQPTVANADCVNPLDRNLALAKKIGVTGTPTIFFTDGTRIPGSVSKESIEKKFAELSVKK